MRCNPQWLGSADCQRIMALLEDGGFEAWYVGGCVRNTLLDQPVRDYDVATNARPEIVGQLAHKAGFHVVPTGIEHGTVTVIIGETAFEITTYRRDVLTDGRRAIVAYSNTIAEDARRRDFTMNALYLNARGELADPLQGLPDLRSRCVRFIGDAMARIAEDHLRVLRFFRFDAWYGDPNVGMDNQGLTACRRSLPQLALLSRERVGAEICKLLSAPDPVRSVGEMEAVGVLSRVMPGSSSDPLARLCALEKSAGVLPDWRRRLVGVGGAKAALNLRLSRKDLKHIAQIAAATHQNTGPAELGYHLGNSVALDVILLRSAFSNQAVPKNAKAEISKGAKAKFPLKASDLVDRFQGPALGKKLKQLEQHWITHGFEPDKSALLQLANLKS